MVSMVEHIIFHSRGKHLTALSNFSPHTLRIDGHSFSCGEAYFHFAKFRAAAKVHAAADSEAAKKRQRQLVAHAAKLADTELGGLSAKRIGGKGAQGLRLEGAELQAWDAEREAVQRKLCQERLAQGPEAEVVRAQLQQSGNAVLVHFERGANPDTYWGGKVVDAGTATARVVGHNTLGRLWMEFRAKLPPAPAAACIAAADQVPKKHRCE